MRIQYGCYNLSYFVVFPFSCVFYVKKKVAESTSRWKWSRFFSSNAENIFLENIDDNCNWLPSDGSDEDPIYGLWFKLDRWKSMFGAHCEYLTSPLPLQLFVIITEEMWLHLLWIEVNDTLKPSHRWTNGPWPLKIIETNGWKTPKPSKNHWNQWSGGWK